MALSPMKQLMSCLDTETPICTGLQPAGEHALFSEAGSRQRRRFATAFQGVSSCVSKTCCKLLGAPFQLFDQPMADIPISMCVTLKSMKRPIYGLNIYKSTLLVLPT